MAMKHWTEIAVEQANSHLLARIREATYGGFQLVIRTSGIIFNAITPWRVHDSEEVLFSSMNSDYEVYPNSLVRARF
jgi:hypothetical protein